MVSKLSWKRNVEERPSNYNECEVLIVKSRLLLSSLRKARSKVILNGIMFRIFPYDNIHS